MNPRDPKVLLGAGTLAVLALLALSKRSTPVPSTGPSPLQVPPSTGPTKLTAHLSDAFFRDVLRMASDYQAKGARIVAEDILGTLNAESGIFPGAKNRLSSCIGMNQVCPTLASDPLSGLRSIGFHGSLDEYQALSAEAQFPFARRFFDNAINGRHAMLTDMGRMYLLNFNPGHLGKPDSFHLYDEATGGNAYRFNQAALDPEHKGFIEIADMDKFVRRSLANNGPLGKQFPSPPFSYWAELRGRLQRVQGVA